MTGRLVLVRHGQSHGNVDRRLDTRPPGAALTDLGRDQARAFARDLPHPPAMIAHSVAVRAAQTAEEISGALGLDAQEFEGIHEVQVGDLENRNDDDAWHGDIVVVSHGAAIRLVSAVLAGVDSSFALDHHLANAESVVLSPITDGRWSCVQWATLTPPFYPEPDAHPVEDALQSADPMG